MPSQKVLVSTFVLVLLIVAGSTLASIIAEDRALDAEEDYVAGNLEDTSCLTEWGTSEGAGPSKDASVTKVTTSGVRVTVTLPYAYTAESDGETVYADTASEALYRVKFTGTQRLAGDEITPC